MHDMPETHGQPKVLQPASPESPDTGAASSSQSPSPARQRPRAEPADQSAEWERLAIEGVNEARKLDGLPPMKKPRVRDATDLPHLPSADEGHDGRRTSRELEEDPEYA